MAKRRHKNPSSKEFDFFIRGRPFTFCRPICRHCRREGRCVRLERKDGLATGQASVPIFDPNPGEATSYRDLSALSPMEIEFAFRKESSGLFGSIGRPVARVIVIHRRRRVPQLFYVDSGADITLIPKSVGDLLGLTLASPQEIREIKGIGERGVPIVIRRIRLQVGSKLFHARIGWCLLEEVPLLLGRWIAFVSSRFHSVMI